MASFFYVIQCYVRDKEELKSNIWKVVNIKSKPMSNSIYHPLYLLMDGVSLTVGTGNWGLLFKTYLPA